MAAGNGRQMGIEARLAVSRDPLDAAIGGDALLQAAVHQLGVLALLLHQVLEGAVRLARGGRSARGDRGLGQGL